MDSAPVVNVVKNGDSTEEPKNDEVTITVTLAKKESGSETESPAIESKQSENLDQIERTQKQVEEQLSITVASSDTNEKETSSFETVTESDAIEQSLITENSPLRVDSVLKMEADKPKTPIDVEEQDVIIEDEESGDDGDESFSEEEDPNEPGTVSSELTAENNNKNEITTTNEPLKEKENDLEEKGKEGLSIGLENDSLQSEHSIKEPIETKIIQPEEHIPVQIEFSDTQRNDSVKSSDQKDFNNQIKEIITDIDTNIKAQERITQLKEQELKLIQKQNELASQIHQQQLLAQQLSDQNKLKPQPNQSESERQSDFNSQPFHQSDRPFQQITTLQCLAKSTHSVKRLYYGMPPSDLCLNWGKRQAIVLKY